MPVVQDHPDWLGTQPSTGPLLYTATGAAPAASTTIYTGQWRSFFMAVTPTAGTGTWGITVDFAEDAANAVKVSSPVTLVGAGVPRSGWQPIIGQYITIKPQLLVPSVGDTIDIKVVPSLLDAPQAARIFTRPFITRYERILVHGAQVFHTAAYSMPGPANLTVRGNQYSALYDLYILDNTGVFQPTMRYQVDGYNQAYTYPLQLPDATVQIAVFNAEPHADLTYDVMLAPV